MASLLDLAQARLGGLLAPQRPSMAGLLGGQRTQGNLASALQGYTPPQMTALTNPQVMDYARNVAQTAQQNLQTQMSDLDKALVMDQGGINVGDRQALARLMEQVPGLMGATAYHGSKSLFDKFDKSKIREGIGTDYGYGAYFAEAPATAKEYMGKQGFFYKTDIPDEFIPKMINWSSSEQPEQVNAILKKAGLPTNTRGEDIYFAAIEKTGGSDAQKSGFQKASEYLDSIGIKGITYPQRSYETDAVSKNFVVFDPTNVKFLERNNQPITGLLDTSYRGSHIAPNANVYGATIDNLGALMPKDVYSSQGIRLYGLMDKTIDNEWYRAVKKAEGNPNAEIEIFRAVPKGVNEINPGDWITTSKKYAKMHGENTLDGEYDIVSKKVKAKTLSSEGYPYEFGYNPD